MILDNLYLGEKGSTPPLSSPKSLRYTNSIGRKIFNYKEALQNINIEEYLKNPLTCDCSHSPFQYNPSGHVITGDVAIGDNGNRLIFEIWWNFFYDLFSIKNVADVNSIDSFVSKRNMDEFSVVIMKSFRSSWLEKTKGRHVTYNTRQSVLRRKRIYNSIGRKILNYKEALQDISIEEYLKNPLTCDCSHSPSQYNPSGHVITGDLNIIQHESLRKVISHGRNFREP
jgi:hypothetical protein